MIRCLLFLPITRENSQIFQPTAKAFISDKMHFKWWEAGYTSLYYKNQWICTDRLSNFTGNRYCKTL